HALCIHAGLAQAAAQPFPDVIVPNFGDHFNRIIQTRDAYRLICTLTTEKLFKGAAAYSFSGDRNTRHACDEIQGHTADYDDRSGHMLCSLDRWSQEIRSG